MAKRLSQYSKQKKAKTNKFDPDIKEWRKVCRLSPYNITIIKHFGISKETFCAFIDRERYKEEQNPKYHSDYVDALKIERMRFRELISDSFYNKISEGDTASVIFGMKLYNGAIEAKDLSALAIKRKELTLKSNQFLSQLAEKFQLDKEEIKQFAEKYFTHVKTDDV